MNWSGPTESQGLEAVSGTRGRSPGLGDGLPARGWVRALPSLRDAPFGCIDSSRDLTATWGGPMRFMMMFQASDASEAGEQPSEKSLTEMGLVMAEMAEKGVLLAGEGLLPSSKGFRMELDSGKRRVVDGPFTETKELIAGFCLIEVASREEAVEWGWRCLAADNGNTGTLEIRQVASADDFGEEFTPEARAREEATLHKAAANLRKSKS